ncbi:toprim domain-containing protein, partial [bacterium]|nr:toprim domain-containing protein [bacterium]
MNWIDQIQSDHSNNGIPLDHIMIMDGGWHNFVSVKCGSNCGYVVDVDKALLRVKNHKSGEGCTLKLEGPPSNECKMVEKASHDNSNLLLEVEDYFNCLPLATSTHLYCVKKKMNIDGLGIRLDGDSLIIPLYDKDGNFQTYQKIDQTGQKQFAKGLSKSGNFFTFGDSEGRSKIVICEGFATGESLYRTLELTVVVAFDAGNLKSVVSHLNLRYEEVIVAADNDSHKKINTGLTKAEEISKQSEVSYTFPLFLGKGCIDSDFNDLYVKFGRAEVSRQFTENLIVPVPKIEQIQAKLEASINDQNYLEFLDELPSYKFNMSQEKRLLATVAEKVGLKPNELVKEMKAKTPN